MHLDSSVFLTLVVAITFGQATCNIVKEQSLSIIQKIIVPALLFIVGIGLYALMHKGVTILMADMPMINQAIPLSWVQIIFGFIFLIGFFVMKLCLQENTLALCKAWKQSWQNQLLKTLESESISQASTENEKPDAQMVFCIDTRSELIRRHIESFWNYNGF